MYNSHLRTLKSPLSLWFFSRTSFQCFYISPQNIISSSTSSSGYFSSILCSSMISLYIYLKINNKELTDKWIYSSNVWSTSSTGPPSIVKNPPSYFFGRSDIVSFASWPKSSMEHTYGSDKALIYIIFPYYKQTRSFYLPTTSWTHPITSLTPHTTDYSLTGILLHLSNHFCHNRPTPNIFLAPISLLIILHGRENR